MFSQDDFAGRYYPAFCSALSLLLHRGCSGATKTSTQWAIDGAPVIHGMKRHVQIWNERKITVTSLLHVCPSAFEKGTEAVSHCFRCKEKEFERFETPRSQSKRAAIFGKPRRALTDLTNQILSLILSDFAYSFGDVIAHRTVRFSS